MTVPRLVVYEDAGWTRLSPLVYTRPVFLLLSGMETLWESTARVAERRTARPLSVWTRDFVADLTREKLGVPVNEPVAGPTLLLNGRGRWNRLPPVDETGREGADWVGVAGGAVACVFASGRTAATLSPEVLLDDARRNDALGGLPRRDVSNCVRLFDWPWQLVQANPVTLAEDWRVRGEVGEIAGRLDPGVHLLNPSGIRIGSGSRVKPCVVIDAEEGPVWIGNNVRIQPHCYIEGPAYVGDGAFLQSGAVIRGGSSIGPVCKVGGEIEGSVLVGYSNKQHDGFLGHSYIGSFVNIAADCINSDLKNTYGTVRVPINGVEVDSGERFVGLTVGDHAKAGINVSFPTGAVMGFCSNVVGPRCPKFVPSFAWIDGDRSDRFDPDRGLAIAKTVMARRNLTMTAAEEAAFIGARARAAAIEHVG